MVLDANCVTNCGHVLCTGCASVYFPEDMKFPLCWQIVSCLCPLPGQSENLALLNPNEMWEQDVLNRLVQENFSDSETCRMKVPGKE